MLQQLINSVFRPKKEIVSDIFFDIDLFNNYIIGNGQLFDEWYFRNIFTTEYWNYLNNYGWLSRNEQNKLHQGILSILLFLVLHFLEGKNRIIEDHLDEINRSLDNFNSNNGKSLKLHQLVKESLKLLKRKNSGVNDEEINAEIYKSITWTLKNIILVDNNNTAENKDKNRR